MLRVLDYFVATLLAMTEGKSLHCTCNMFFQTAASQALCDDGTVIILALFSIISASYISFCMKTLYLLTLQICHFYRR